MPPLQTTSSHHLDQGEAHVVNSDRDQLRDNHILRTGSLPQDRTIFRKIALTVSLCAEISVAAMISGHEIICGILLPLGMSGIAWIYLAESHTPDAKSQRSKILPLVMMALIALACIIGIFLLSAKPHYGVLAQGGAPKNGNRIGKKADDNPEGSYVSVILWPNRPQAAKIVVPSPRLRPTTLVRLSRPLVIPFEGAYWYFRSPAKAPGRSAHVARGSPTKISIYSTDWRPLIMEAHQRLASPIDPRCCRELDLSILNADDRPGTIRIAVELIDLSSPHAQSEDLGSRPVRSSMPPEFSLNRAPTKEVIRYPIPANPAIRHFDEIEVIFLPSKERSLGGAQIAIRSFQLIPSF